MFLVCAKPFRDRSIFSGKFHKTFSENPKTTPERAVFPLRSMSGLVLTGGFQFLKSAPLACPGMGRIKKGWLFFFSTFAYVPQGRVIQKANVLKIGTLVSKGLKFGPAIIGRNWESG